MWHGDVMMARVRKKQTDRGAWRQPEEHERRQRNRDGHLVMARVRKRQTDPATWTETDGMRTCGHMFMKIYDKNRDSGG